MAHGARVSAINNEGLTPIELTLRGCSNIDIVDAVDVANILLEAGASKSEQCKIFVAKIGQTFEFSREGFNKDSVDLYSNALDQLYALFDVKPIARRLNYDGKSPIIAKATTWQQQHEELWQMLVPSGGHASTVQGELVRVSGRISREIEGNGGINWDADFTKMAEHFAQMLKLGLPSPDRDIDEAAQIAKSIKTVEGGSLRLAQLAVTWVSFNPVPLLLATVPYKR